MTLGEIKRAVESKLRVDKVRAQERASFDYILSNLIGASIGCALDSNASMPPIEEVYKSLFAEQAEKRKEVELDRQTQLSIARLKQFATFHNNKMNKEVAKDSE